MTLVKENLLVCNRLKAENLLIKIAKGMMGTGSHQSCRETFIMRMRTTLPIGQQ